MKPYSMMGSGSEVLLLPSLLSGLYVFCSILSNIFSVKIVLVPFLNWAVDGGTILYPLSFVVRDMMHKNGGRKFADYTVIFTGFLVTLMALLIKVVIMLPSDPSWKANQEAFSQTLSSTWRIVLSGITVQMMGNLLNTRIFAFVFKRLPGKDVFASLSSNGVALLFDTLLFCFLAFAFTYPWHVVFQIMGINLILKLLIVIIFSPVMKLIKRKVPLNLI